MALLTSDSGSILFDVTAKSSLTFQFKLRNYLHTINSPGYDRSSIAATNSTPISGKHHFELNLDWPLDYPYHSTNVNHDSMTTLDALIERN